MFSKIRRYVETCDNCSSSPLPSQNLAITPSEIMQLTASGVAASSSNLGLSYSEGSVNPVLLIENTRGIDPADVWESSQTAKDSLVKAHKKDKEYYG